MLQYMYTAHVCTCAMHTHTHTHKHTYILYINTHKSVKYDAEQNKHVVFPPYFLRMEGALQIFEDCRKIVP